MEHNKFVTRLIVDTISLTVISLIDALDFKSAKPQGASSLQKIVINTTSSALCRHFVLTFFLLLLESFSFLLLSLIVAPHYK